MPEIKETEQITRTGAKALENTGTAEANNDPQDALYQKTQALVLQAENCVDTANEKLEEIESTAAEIQEALSTKKDAILHEITVKKQAACNDISEAGTEYIELAEEKFNQIIELDPANRNLSNITTNGINVIKQSLSDDITNINNTLTQKLSKSECKAFITETYQNGSSWYRIWSDGWCEQGGTAPTNTSSVTFLKKFTNADTIYINAHKLANSNEDTWHSMIRNITTTSFTLQKGQYSSAAANLNSSCKWEAKGYIK